jgi:hypothetical protein
VSNDAGHTWCTREFTIRFADDDWEKIHAAPDSSDGNRPGLSIRTLAAILSPNGERTLVSATWARVHLSQDDGDQWQPAWDSVPFVTTEQPSQQSVTVVATATIPSGGHILADIETGRGSALRLIGSRDGGATWVELPAPVDHAYVKGLALTPDSGLNGTLYVAADGASDHRLTVWSSEDGGKRWQTWLEHPGEIGFRKTLIVALPANPWADSLVLALRNQILRPRPNAWEVKQGVRRPVWESTELLASIAGLTASPDYAQNRTLFAATSAGVYVSRDGGASFTLWSDGLEPKATVAVAVSPAYAEDRLVYGLGLGGTIWRRTDR